jgi:probable F420-dependent oxidoreductase
MPRFMSRFLDPFLALTRAATVTERLRFGTGIVLAPQRDTIQLAKEVSTLDFLSGGRFIFGIGAGWNLEEMRNHGVHPPDRWRRMREQTLAMKAIWTADEAEFHGDLVDFDPIQMWPKPVQRPHPPVLIGGEGPTVLQRVLDYGDGWLPNDHPELPERVAELRRLATDGGRGVPPVTAFAVAPDPARIEQLIAAGVGRCVFNLPDSVPVDVLTALDRLAGLVRPYS